jgi:uncharacterized protein (TIGR02246 family)
MMTIGVLVAALTAMTTLASAQSSGNAGAAKEADLAIAREVLAAQKTFYQAYRTCNEQDMASLVTDDLMYLFSVGFMHKGKTEFLKSLEPAGCGWDVLQVDVDINDVRIYGDTAILFGNFRYKGKNAEPIDANLMAMQVFVKRDGKWLFAANSTTEAVPLGASKKLKAQ